MKKVYIAHPYGGLEENKISVEKIITELVLNMPNRLYISPIHALGYLYNLVDYKTGMDYCFELLHTCDVLVLCDSWEKSTGCCMEKEYAYTHGIQIIYYKNGRYYEGE